MSQSATADYRTQILADADLAHLGKPKEDYIETAINYFCELNPGVEINSAKGLAYLKDQVPFLNNHTFNTPEASRLFNHKAANIEYAQSLIDQTDSAA